MRILIFIFSFLSFHLNGQVDSSLIDAIVNNDFVKVKIAIENGANVNAKDSLHATPLMWAVYKANLKLTKLLLEEGASTEVKGIIRLDNKNYYSSLLGIAAGEGRLEHLKYLIDSIGIVIDERGYNPKTSKRDRMTPIQWAANNNKTRVIGYLIDKGANEMEIAYIYLTKGNHEEADRIYKTNAIRTADKYGKSSIKYLNALYELVGCHWVQDEYKKALDGLDTLVKFSQKMFPDNHPTVANFLHDRGTLLKKIGFYDEALNAYQYSIEIYKANIQKDTVAYALALNDLGEFYKNIGNYKRAQTAHEEAASLFKASLGEMHSYHLNVLISLGIIHKIQKNYRQAEYYLREAFEKKIKKTGTSSRAYIRSLYTLGSLYSDMGKLEQALDTLKKVEIAIPKFYKKTHRMTTQTLNKLGDTYFRLGNLMQAKKYYEKALKINAGHWGNKHNKLVPKIQILAGINESLGESVESAKLYQQGISISINWMQQQFSSFSEMQQERLLNAYNNTFEKFQSTTLRKSKLVGEALNAQLFLNGLLLDNKKNLLTTLKSETDTTILIAFKEWQNLTETLAKIYALPKKSRIINTDSISNRISDLESLLARKSRTIQNKRALITYDDILGKLDNNQAVLTFSRFQYHCPLRATDSTYYVAYVLKAGEKRPIIKYLFEEQELTQLFSLQNRGMNEQMLHEAYASRGLTPKGKRRQIFNTYDLIWRPIDSLLEGIKTIYFTPAGLLHRLNVGAIPIDSLQVLGDKYEIIQLFNTRSLLQNTIQDVNSQNTAYVVGGVHYDLEEPPYTESILFDSINTISPENYFTYVNRSLREDNWSYLPWTLVEGETINTIAEENGYIVNFKSKHTATEANFKKLGTIHKSPKIIHLATHGFFFPDLNNNPSYIINEPVFKISEHPMLRSGLLMAGANRVWEGAEPIPNEEDGILTAYEISNMNLTSTELVVLSACETGLGDIRGSEGVYGLQRAFKKAGVKYLLMSLWQVPDKETSTFMTTFYKNWLEQKMSIRDAFNTTQKIMRKQFGNPYLWAGFVLME